MTEHLALFGHSTVASYCDTDDRDDPPAPADPYMEQAIKEVCLMIMVWDMTMIIKRLVDEGHSPDTHHATEMVGEYMRYMALSAVYKGVNLPMSAKVDEAWHAHILHTRDYADFCQQIAGRFIHHLPAMGEDDRIRMAKDYANNTLGLYERHFGKAPAKWWGGKQAVCYDPGCKNNCSGE